MADHTKACPRIVDDEGGDAVKRLPRRAAQRRTARPEIDFSVSFTLELRVDGLCKPRILRAVAVDAVG